MALHDLNKSCPMVNLSSLSMHKSGNVHYVNVTCIVKTPQTFRCVIYIHHYGHKNIQI